MFSSCSSGTTQPISGKLAGTSTLDMSRTPNDSATVGLSAAMNVTIPRRSSRAWSDQII